MKEGDQACTEGDTGVSKSFLSLLLESNRGFLFISIFVLFLFPSFVFVDPNETNSLEVAFSL